MPSQKSRGFPHGRKNPGTVEPREFFIEDRLEKYRLQAECNLGESGIRAYTLGEIFRKTGVDFQEWESLSLEDSPNRGSRKLREEIAMTYGGSVGPDQILVTTGTSEALYILFHLLLRAGDRASLFMPAFQALYEIPKMLGAEIDSIFVDSYDRECLPIADILGKKAKLTILNHPHNPTGLGIRSEDWEILSGSYSCDRYLLFDEHYRFLDFSQDTTRSGACIHPNAFATGSITKCFGVVGLKLGWLVGDSTILDRARSFKDYLTHTVSPLSEYLARKILENRHSLQAEIKSRVMKNILVWEENLSGLKSIVGYRRPQGGLVGFLKLAPHWKSEEYADRLYRDTSVFVLPGSNFEREGYLRIGFGEEPNRFREGILRWREWDSKQGDSLQGFGDA